MAGYITSRWFTVRYHDQNKKPVLPLRQPLYFTWSSKIFHFLSYYSDSPIGNAKLIYTCTCKFDKKAPLVPLRVESTTLWETSLGSQLSRRMMKCVGSPPDGVSWVAHLDLNRAHQRCYPDHEVIDLTGSLFLSPSHYTYIYYIVAVQACSSGLSIIE